MNETMASDDIGKDGALPPSGRWRGYYLYSRGGQQHGQSMHLRFLKAQLSGDGSDDIGEFQVIGTYDPAGRVAQWTKRYASHDVQYRGYYENARIWGVWNIDALRGGFEIWPTLLSDPQQSELERVILEVFEANARDRDLTMNRLLSKPDNP